MAPPPPVVMMQMVMGRWVSQAIGAAAQVGLADRLPRGETRSADELAAAASAHGPSVYRLLRARASVGIFAEGPPGRFAHTPLSELLRDDTPGSLKPMALFMATPEHVRAWIDIQHSVRTGECAFTHAHGKLPWDYLHDHPALGEIFNNAMTSFSAMAAGAVLQAYDFSGIGTLADVGGGHGFLLGSILASRPEMRGILFDLPQVVEGAGPTLAKFGVEGRVTRQGGDFFAGAPKADAYILKHILHDWSDADSVRILSSVRAAAGPSARVLIVELVVEPRPGPDLAKLMDLEMLVVTSGGRERTEPEWNAVLTQAGLRLARIVPTMSPHKILEAVPA
ncbi:MAG: methyltransferase [Deltaproteobacteria bacterium]|nr:methyltransferase [Deltaproteobacteria bacterium]